MLSGWRRDFLAREAIDVRQSSYASLSAFSTKPPKLLDLLLVYAEQATKIKSLSLTDVFEKILTLQITSLVTGLTVDRGHSINPVNHPVKTNCHDDVGDDVENKQDQIALDHVSSKP